MIVEDTGWQHHEYCIYLNSTLCRFHGQLLVNFLSKVILLTLFRFCQGVLLQKNLKQFEADIINKQRELKREKENLANVQQSCESKVSQLEASYCISLLECILLLSCF